MQNKKITFENFIRGLKWSETGTSEEKLRGKKQATMIIEHRVEQVT